MIGLCRRKIVNEETVQAKSGESLRSARASRLRHRSDILPHNAISYLFVKIGTSVDQSWRWSLYCRSVKVDELDPSLLASNGWVQSELYTKA